MSSARPRKHPLLLLLGKVTLVVARLMWRLLALLGSRWARKKLDQHRGGPEQGRPLTSRATSDSVSS